MIKWKFITTTKLFPIHNLLIYVLIQTMKIYFDPIVAPRFFSQFFTVYSPSVVDS